MNLRVFLLASLCLVPWSLFADGDTTSTNVPVNVIMERVLAQRAPHDLALKARLWVDRGSPTPVEILVKHLPDETRTIYRTGTTAALIVQPTKGAPRYYLQGVGELTGEARLQRLAGSRFTLYDLALPFLRWPDVKVVGSDRTRGRNCHLLEAKSEGEPYSAVRLWIDKEAFAVLRAEARNEYGDPIRRFTVTSFRKSGELWLPRGMEMGLVPPGQSLPAEDKSRLEIYETNDNPTLPLADFEPDRFGK